MVSADFDAKIPVRVCGHLLSAARVRLASDYVEIKMRLKFAANAPNYEPNWNKPLTMPMLVAVRSVDGRRVSTRLHANQYPNRKTLWTACHSHEVDLHRRQISEAPFE